MGQAPVRWLRPAQAYILEGVHSPGLLRGAGREGETARAGLLPLVLGEPQERRSRGSPVAIRLCAAIPARTADTIRQARIRVQQPQAFQRSRTAADREIRTVKGR